MPAVICPGCGIILKSSDSGTEERYNASRACYKLYMEKVYTLSLNQDGYFIHQVLVDAYAAQHCGPTMKPITITFALVGLYLVFEKGYTGRQAQLAHIELGKKRRAWPRFNAPTVKATLTVHDVLNRNGPGIKKMVMKWGKSVWDTWKPEHGRVAALVKTYLKI